MGEHFDGLKICGIFLRGEFPVSKILINENQLRKWIEAAAEIKAHFGADRALAYLIGEKFYSIISMLRSCRQLIRTIDEERKKPDYHPIGVATYRGRNLVTNLNESYKREVFIITWTEELLVKFAALIGEAFEPYEIRTYLEAGPPLGAMAHICSEEEYEFLVGRGIVEHSLDSEIEDAMIFGDMLKYFSIT
jgi:hypothetical protein